ncbi:hypothetical protein QE152_g30814 [Popillia japonica]|uniref:Uncharacterized protein n=1 Tax=Popillia japonica TaxID=7064 RepID=A0AAW1JCX5_POPJA
MKHNTSQQFLVCMQNPNVDRISKDSRAAVPKTASAQENVYISDSRAAVPKTASAQENVYISLINFRLHWKLNKCVKRISLCLGIPTGKKANENHLFSKCL